MAVDKRYTVGKETIREDSEALKSEVVKMMDSMKQLENAIETFRLN